MSRYAELRREWAEVVEQWRESGLSGAEFCRQHNLSVQRFYGWRRRLGKTPSGGCGFVPLSFSGQGGGNGIALVVGERVRVELCTGFDQHELVRVLGVLSAC
jgi:hypothetical protein